MIRGNGPAPSLVLLLIQRLPEESLTVALANGGRDRFGWSRSVDVLAHIFDAINVNTRSTGNWKKGKAPDFPEFPRPKSNKRRSAKTNAPDGKFSVAALHRRFLGGS